MHVPQRETGMIPYEIMLSESQERMLLVVERGREHEVEAVFEKWDLHAVQIGEVTPKARALKIHERGTLVADVPNRGAHRRSAGLSPADARAARGRRACSELSPGDLGAAAVRRSRPSIGCSRCRRSPASAGRIASTITRSAPTPSRSPACRRRSSASKDTARGLAVSVDGNGRFCYLDPYRGAMLAVAEAARNVACAGGEPIGATNNLNFGNPERPEIMWQIGEAVRGIGDACRALDIADHRRQRQPLQRDRRPRDLSRRPCSAWSALLEDASQDRDADVQDRRMRRSCCWAIIEASSAAANTWQRCMAWWPGGRRRST